VPLWRIFGKPGPPPHAAWWAAADTAAEAPTPDTIERLRAGMAAPAAGGDDHERQEEMVDGLQQLLSVMQSDQLPKVQTGHRHRR
jgi:hypothetical protein